MIKTKLSKQLLDHAITFVIFITVWDANPNGDPLNGKLKLPKSHGNDATAIALVRTGVPSVKDEEPVLYIQQVRRKKRSLHEETPRNGRKEPNRTAARNSKNTKAVTVTKRRDGKKVSVTACLFDRVELNGKKGWITGFTGKACRIVDTEGNYVAATDKYTQVNISSIRILHHTGNWVTGLKRNVGKR